MKFRKIPVVIEAFQWNGQTELPPWADDVQTILHHQDTLKPIELVIKTLEGNMRAIMGDWIIRGVKGELYPCKPDIFEMTYEKVGDQ